MKHLSTKELNYIKDFLSWELLSAKKCSMYAMQQVNTEHKQIFLDAAAVHQQNYTRVLDYLNNVNSGQGGQLS